jgi:hypothetical protein
MNTNDHHLGEDLAAMADGGRGLEAARFEALSKHVAACRECQTAIAAARTVLEVIEKREEQAPSPAFDRAMFARLDAIDREQPGLLARVRQLLSTGPRLGFAMAAATAAVVLVAVFTRAPAPDADPAVLASAPAEIVADPDALAVAEELDLFRDYDVIEDLDVLEDLEVIEAMDGEQG